MRRTRIVFGVVALLVASVSSGQSGPKPIALDDLLSGGWSKAGAGQPSEFDIKKAQQVIAQKDRILAQAQEEANRTVALAREKSEKMLEKFEVYQAAQAKVEQLSEQARKDSLQTQQEADRYVVETLGGLERELKNVLQQVQNGIKSLQPGSDSNK